MKKAIVTILYIILAITVLLIGSVFVLKERYSDQAIKILKSYLDDKLVGEIHIQKNDIHLTILKSFPYAGIELNNIVILSPHGIRYEDFTETVSDTLLKAKQFSFMINLQELMHSNYELKAIKTKDAKLLLLTDKQGKVNYKIFKTDSAHTPQQKLKVNLSKVLFDHIEITYIDKQGGSYAKGTVKKAKINGRFKGANIYSNIDATLNNVSYSSSGNTYLSNQNINIITNLQKQSDTFEINQGQFILSGLLMNIEGHYNASKKYYQIQFISSKAPIKELNQPLFFTYLNKSGFEPQNGRLSVSATVSGYLRQSTPYISTRFILTQGHVVYKEKNLKLENILAKGHYTNGDAQSRSTTRIILDTLSLQMGSSKVDIRCDIKNLTSPLIEGSMKGRLDLGQLEKFDSIKKQVSLTGTSTFDLLFKGKLPELKNFETWYLGQLDLTGIISLEDNTIKSLVNPLPEAIVSGKIRLSNFDKIILDNIYMRIGNSDLTINGKALNFPVFQKNKNVSPVYECLVNSNHLDINDFLTKSGTKSDAPDKKVTFPKSLIINTAFKAKQFVFGNFSATNVSGKAEYSPDRLEIKDFKLNVGEGAISSNLTLTALNGYINSYCLSNFNNLNISGLFTSFNNFGQEVILSKNLGGHISGRAVIYANWDMYLNPKMDDLKVNTEFIIDNGVLKDYDPLMSLSTFIEVEELKELHFDELNSEINISEKEISISKTHVSSSAISFVAQGTHTFDNEFEYRLQVALSDLLFKKARKKKPSITEFGYIEDDGVGHTIIPILIKGNPDDFKVSYDKKKGRDIFRRKMKEEKEELKSLFTDEPEHSTNNNNEEHKINWDDTHPKDNDPSPDEPKQERAAPLPTNKSKDQPEHEIIWDD